ncbi:hypothetical protein LLG96_10015 [bacterium]|nr:hypothetical protein [bacterium]
MMRRLISPGNRIITAGVILLLLNVLAVGCRKPADTKIPGKPAKLLSVRKIVVLNDNWHFQIDVNDIGEQERWYAGDFDRNAWTPVTVPGAWDCYDEALWGYEGIGWYATTIDLGDFDADKRTELIFNRVMYYSRVWIDGEYIGENIGGYLPFSFDVTDHLQPGKTSTLVLRVDNRPRIEWLPAAKRIEWMQYGGILQPVRLVGTSKTRIADLAVTAVPDKGGANVSCTVEISNTADTDNELVLSVEIEGVTGQADTTVNVHTGPGETTKVPVEISIEKAEAWSPDSPVLYTVTASLTHNGDIIDTVSDRFGIRAVTTNGTDILLNGIPVTIKGVNRYDDYDRMGPVVPTDVLRRELKLMKQVGINTIRVHYPQSPDLLSLYDEYGFMMIEEVPINWWGQDWWGRDGVNQSLEILDQAKPVLRKMVARDKNHPCVIIWSMANESKTNNDIGITVMRELIRLAKSLDKTRLVTFVANGDPREHRAFDEADIVCFNKYYGIFEGQLCRHTAQIDSFAYQPTVNILTLMRSYFGNKPIVITEFGARGIRTIHGDVYYSEDFQAAYISRIWDAIRSVHGISGGVLWCWADYYHRRDFFDYAVFGPYGVVSVDRKPKFSLDTLARMYGGTLSDKK